MASFEWFVSLRYLRAKRKQKFISLITVISILGVAVGVLALIVVLSVYTGFTEGLRDQIIGVNAMPWCSALVPASPTVKASAPRCRQWRV